MTHQPSLKERSKYQNLTENAEISRLYKFKETVHYYFVLIDRQLSLSALADVCASEKIEQLENWEKNGRLLMVSDPHLIPGAYGDSAELIRCDEAYLLKPDLQQYIVAQYDTEAGNLISCVPGSALPALLKSQKKVLSLTTFVELDLAIEMLRGGRSISLNGLIAIGSAEVIPLSKAVKGPLFDVFMQGGGTLIRPAERPNFASRMKM